LTWSGSSLSLGVRGVHLDKGPRDKEAIKGIRVGGGLGGRRGGGTVGRHSRGEGVVSSVTARRSVHTHRLGAGSELFAAATAGSSESAQCVQEWIALAGIQKDAAKHAGLTCCPTFSPHSAGSSVCCVGVGIGTFTGFEARAHTPGGGGSEGPNLPTDEQLAGGGGWSVKDHASHIGWALPLSPATTAVNPIGRRVRSSTLGPVGRRLTGPMCPLLPVDVARLPERLVDSAAAGGGLNTHVQVAESTTSTFEGEPSSAGVKF